MNDRQKKRHPDKVGRTLVKAFAFAGAILGVGAFGLARALILFGREMNWLSQEPDLGRAYWWVVGGCVVGLFTGVMLVTTRRRRD